MFHLVKLVFLLSILPGAANAQWGTVVAQPDTNRFINSQQDFGLVMPHQQVVVGLLDTTITSVGTGGGNAYKVIVGSLLDYEDNCVNYSITDGVASCEGSYELWREMEKSTSWYQAARGDTTKPFPTNYAITISTGQDSVNIWNRDTAELWMAFGKSGNFLSTGTSADIDFLDGILRIAQSDRALLIADFLTGELFQITNSVNLKYGGIDVQTRNGTSSTNTAFTSPVLVNTNVNAIAAVRDPFGIKDALGRPKHWWTVATDANINIYNPHANAIHDEASTGQAANLVHLTREGITGYYQVNAGTGAGLFVIGSAYGKAADGFNENYLWRDNQTGDRDLAWTTSSVGSAIASVSGGSIIGRNAPKFIYGSDEGLYQLHHSTIASNAGLARQRFSSTVNAPVGVGNAVLTMALEDNTTDSSPYGNAMTATNSPTTVVGVFGNAYKSATSSSMSITNSKFSRADATITGYVHMWIKSDSATNPATAQMFYKCSSAGSAPLYVFFVESDGGLTGQINGTSGEDNANSTVDIYDANWHHIAMRMVDGKIYIYADGVQVASDESVGSSGNITCTLAVVGASIADGTQYFPGTIDDVVVGHSDISVETLQNIHAEGRKKLGMGAPVFTRTTDDALLSNNVVDIDALDNGMWAVAFSDANTVQVFDGRIPVQQIAAPAGTVKSLALIQSPGADSVGVAIGTTTNLKFVQPAVNLRAAMAHQYKEPIHVGESVVVDSAGMGGIFWTADDALDAGLNAGVGEVLVLGGTYGVVTMDQNGMMLRCADPKWTLTSEGTLFMGDGTNAAIHISGAGQIVANCGFYSAPGGAGGGAHAVRLGGGGNPAYGNKFRHNIVLDADDACINMNESGGNGQGQVHNNTIHDCDGIGIDTGVSADGINIVDNHITSGGTGIQLISGANVNVVVGNATDTGISNSGSGNVVTGNVQY